MTEEALQAAANVRAGSLVAVRHPEVLAGARGRRGDRVDPGRRELGDSAD